jgi:putative hydrolase of the HAD superfamily
MTKLIGIKAVSSDVDGTLWDFDAVMRRSLRETLLELATRDPEAAAMLDVERMIAIRDRVHEGLRGKTSDLIEIRNEGFKQALRDAGRPDDALAMHLTNVYVKHRWAGMELFADVRPTLKVLARKYALGMLSNGAMSPEDFGLEVLIDFSVSAQDHGGVEKPDPRLFQIALEEAGCSAIELVHVGDSLETDVSGAASAGVISVWLNRSGAQADREIEPDFEISTLTELLKIL